MGVPSSLLLELHIILVVVYSCLVEPLDIFYILEVVFVFSNFLFPSSCWFFPLSIILDSGALLLVGARN
jgi:hypothetical protein